MATLILTAVGSAIGGPIGGAIGAILGQQVDGLLFAPKKRQGPRLGDLSVQTSSYGTAIPRLFGTMRVAGTVIWSTDLIESRATTGGGKGQPKTVNYSYAASFAVALSGRPVRAIGRIWADGKLLRGAAGDFKSECRGFRLLSGDADQAADPLIAAAEGGVAPAYRGTAYAVFEELQLADFGNRIPSLSFEVEADPGPVAIGDIAAALAPELAAGTAPAVSGFAASGDSARGAIEALTDLAPLSLIGTAEGTAIGLPDGDPIAIPAAEESGRRTIGRKGASAVPGEVSLTYYDAGRDYLTGLQRAAAGSGLRADRRAAAAALSAEAAKGLVEARLADLWARRTTAQLTLGWRQAAIRPGTRATIEGEAGLWAVTRSAIGPMTVTLDLRRLPATTLAAAEPASAGRPRAEIDQIHGATTLRAMELPIGEAQTAPALYVAAAGIAPGWRRAALSLSLNGGASWQAIGPTAAPAVMGTTSAALGPGGSALIDTRGAIEVTLLHDAMTLESRDDDALAAGANLALIGGELIQFGAAARIGPAQWRLGRLLRGRRGTEAAGPGHAAGEAFTLIEAGALRRIDLPAGSLGGEATLLAQGLGDDEPAVAARPITGLGLYPPSPVHLSAVRDGTGVSATWVRRSRSGWAWTDGIDSPVGEEAELYRVTLTAGGTVRTESVAVPALATTMPAGPLRIEVVQIGTFGASAPATLDLP